MDGVVRVPSCCSHLLRIIKYIYHRGWFFFFFFVAMVMMLVVGVLNLFIYLL